MKKNAFYSNFFGWLAVSVFVISISGLLTPVSAQFDFGDDSDEAAEEEDSSSDDGGFSLGDDSDDSSDSDDSDDSESGDDDSDGASRFSFGDDSDTADAESDKTETAGLELGSDKTPKVETKKSAAKPNAVAFASNGQKAGDEAKLVLHGVEYRFRWCPAGNFQMGSPMKEVGRKLNEKQMDAVVPHGFWMLETEVTMQMFASFVRKTGYKTDAERDSVGAYHVDVTTGQTLGPDPGYSWKKTGFHLEKDYPVCNITWYDAQKFVEWLNAEISTNEDPIDSKRQVRLPSEMQWEYACRAGNTHAYASGDKIEDLIQHANLREVNQNMTLMKSDIYKYSPWSLPEEQTFRYSSPVAIGTPNAWGIFDMHGNVWEWCDDGFADYEQALIPAENAPDLQKFIGRVGPAIQNLKVMRGGGWNTDFHYARSASRGSNPPSRRFVALGFRFIILPMEVEKVDDDSETDEDTSDITKSIFGEDEDSARDEKSEETDASDSEDEDETSEDETSEESDDEDSEESGGFDF